jgi:hypothetical protein
MNPNIKLSERLAIMATLDPASVAASTVTTSWVSMANLHSLMALINTGVLGASATVDAKLQQAQDSGGTGVKDITGKAITQIVKATGDNKQATIECRDTDLDANNGFAFVRLSLTVGVAASIVGATMIGGNPIFVPASALNQAAVVQQV